jgi:hypothetical protein
MLFSIGAMAAATAATVAALAQEVFGEHPAAVFDVIVAALAQWLVGNTLVFHPCAAKRFGAPKVEQKKAGNACALPARSVVPKGTARSAFGKTHVGFWIKMD